MDFVWIVYDLCMVCAVCVTLCYEMCVTLCDGICVDWVWTY
jgi:hypothetical protein